MILWHYLCQVITPSILVENTRLKLVRLGSCKDPPGTLPIPQKLFNLKLLYQKLLLMCSLLGKANLVLTTGFEPATGFLLRITNPVLSAIQPSQLWNWSVPRDSNSHDVLVPNEAAYQLAQEPFKIGSGSRSRTCEAFRRRVMSPITLTTCISRVKTINLVRSVGNDPTTYWLRASYSASWVTNALFGRTGR